MMAFRRTVQRWNKFGTCHIQSQKTVFLESHVFIHLAAYDLLSCRTKAGVSTLTLGLR